MKNRSNPSLCVSLGRFTENWERICAFQDAEPRATRRAAPRSLRATSRPPPARADELAAGAAPVQDALVRARLVRSRRGGSCRPGWGRCRRAVGSGAISGRESPDSFLNAGGWGETFESGHSESLPVAVFRFACHVRLHLILFYFFPR